MRSLVWFRGKDLRVADHGPLHDSARRGSILCLFVLDPYFFAPERAQRIAHRMQFLLESLASLKQNLEHIGVRLVVVNGKSIDVVPRLAQQWHVDRVVAQRWTEPFARERDRRVAAALHVPFELFEGETLAPPGSVRNGSGAAYSVFTPFAKALRAKVTFGEPFPVPVARDIQKNNDDLGIDDPIPTLRDLGIVRNPQLLSGGERAARDRLRAFLATRASSYHAERDRLDLATTSRLSADLKFGTLSPRTVWHAAASALANAPEAWLRFSNELLWREFSHSVLFENPDLLTQPHRRDFEAFPWQNDEDAFRKWAEGKTGYPVVDASARQLLGEGFVHNRARMLSASFLTKDLLVDYRKGEAHYMAFLTDGDWAQNNAGWQWATGCGFDAQPYFRVFNPIEQGKKFDPTGAYVRRWVPELKELPDAYLHEPWKAPPLVLRSAGVTLGTTYPRPMVDHAEARKRFLALGASIRRDASSEKVSALGFDEPDNALTLASHIEST
jgi:deoxyribodipyrimidine photo-lyase